MMSNLDDVSTRVKMLWTAILFISAVFAAGGSYIRQEGKIDSVSCEAKRNTEKIERADERIRMLELANERACSDRRYMIQQLEKINTKLDSWEIENEKKDR